MLAYMFRPCRWRPQPVEGAGAAAGKAAPAKTAEPAQAITQPKNIVTDASGVPAPSSLKFL